MWHLPEGRRSIARSMRHIHDSGRDAKRLVPGQGRPSPDRHCSHGVCVAGSGIRRGGGGVFKIVLPQDRRVGANGGRRGDTSVDRAKMGQGCPRTLRIWRSKRSARDRERPSGSGRVSDNSPWIGRNADAHVRRLCRSCRAPGFSQVDGLRPRCDAGRIRIVRSGSGPRRSFNPGLRRNIRLLGMHMGKRTSSPQRHRPKA